MISFLILSLHVSICSVLYVLKVNPDSFAYLQR